jgi:hypothetical protein
MIEWEPDYMNASRDRRQFLTNLAGAVATTLVPRGLLAAIGDS